MYNGFIMVNDEYYLKVNLENLLHTVLTLSFFLFFQPLDLLAGTCQERFCCK